jgi:hypothetical protein
VRNASPQKEQGNRTYPKNLEAALLIGLRVVLNFAWLETF